MVGQPTHTHNQHMPHDNFVGRKFPGRMPHGVCRSWSVWLVEFSCERLKLNHPRPTLALHTISKEQQIGSQRNRCAISNQWTETERETGEDSIFIPDNNKICIEISSVSVAYWISIHIFACAFAYYDHEREHLNGRDDSRRTMKWVMKKVIVQE